MKLQAWFIILHLLEAVAGETSIDEPRRTSRTTAKVYMNLTGPLIPPRFNSDFNPKCNRPQEDPNLFRACHASGSPDFPAMHAICKCAQCDWEVLLKCQSDGAWYATEANVCTARYNCHKKCTIDELAKVESPVHCSYIKIGSLIKMHECRCKSNCLKTEVRCDETEGWVIDETPCRDFGVGRVKLEGNLTYLFQNGLYTYGCEPGFILDGNLTNRCEDGLLFGDAPKCVPVAPVIGKTADNVTTAKDFDGSTVEYISIPVTAFCIILILLTLAVIGCGVWIWKSHKSRITTPTSEVPTLLTRINIEAFADNPTDPRYV